MTQRSSPSGLAELAPLPTRGDPRGRAVEAPAWMFAHMDQRQVPTSRSRAPTGTSQTLHKTFHRKSGPKVGGESNQWWTCVRQSPRAGARITQCPRRARWPASPAASHAHTTLLGASGARRCGSLDCAPWSLRASSTRPRATAAAATRAPRGVWARCMRAATECAPPPPERHRGAARAPPNAQESERARACKARRAR